MFDVPYALALAAGMAATVNPCGFALLPAYLSSFLGTDQRAGTANTVVRAVAVSLAMTAGFVVVFGLFGLIVSPLALSIEAHLPWVTIVIGVALIALGATLLAGRNVSVRVPKLDIRVSDGSPASMFLFGVSYAVASLSCTIAPFLAVTTSTFRSSSLGAGIAVFLAYALGMGVVIGALTVALAVAKASIVGRFRQLLPQINRIAGLLAMIAGTYVAYYGWYEIRVQRGATSDPVIDRGTRIQTWLQNHIVPDNPVTVAMVMTAILAVVALAAIAVRRRAIATPDATQSRDAPGQSQLVQCSLDDDRACMRR